MEGENLDGWKTIPKMGEPNRIIFYGYFEG